MMKNHLYGLAVFFFSLASAQITGKAVKVVDGDTFHLLTQERQLYKIRVADIDAPESGQPFGRKAKDFVFSEIFGKSVEVKETKRDRYGRTVGYVCYDRNKDLGEELITAGLAWVWRFSNSEKYKKLQDQAREEGKGLCAIDPCMGGGRGEKIKKI